MSHLFFLSIPNNFHINGLKIKLLNLKIDFSRISNISSRNKSNFHNYLPIAGYKSIQGVNHNFSAFLLIKKLKAILNGSRIANGIKIRLRLVQLYKPEIDHLWQNTTQIWNCGICVQRNHEILSLRMDFYHIV